MWRQMTEACKILGLFSPPGSLRFVVVRFLGGEQIHLSLKFLPLLCTFPHILIASAASLQEPADIYKSLY